MPTYDFKPEIKDLIVADSWTVRFAGVHYIEGVSQDGFIASIILHTAAKPVTVPLKNDTERPESPMTPTTLNAWIEAELIKHEV